MHPMDSAFRSNRSRRLAPASWALAACVFLPGVLAPRAMAATLPSGFSETKLLSKINPTTLEVAPDGRVFYCEKSGQVRVVKNGELLPTPFVSLDVDFTEERGLLGIAFDPAYATNPYVYLYYTAKNPSHNRISRFKANGDVSTGQEQVLLDLENLTSVGWHNGGAIHFGKDGKLYIASGNNTNNTYSQSIDALLGKVLRINPDGTIPSDNPWYNTSAGNKRAVWALGLRNPFTTAIHPVTGRIFVNDVGQGTYEEINEGKPSANYGWPKAEGHVNTAPTGLTGTYVDPLANYPHGEGCAITGGTFYHPAANSFGDAYQDLYFYSDYCGGWIKTLDPAKGNAVKSFATGISRPLDIKAGPDGSLYYVARGARAQGVGAGSPADNTSTADGGLFKIKGPITTGLASRAGPGMLPVLAGAGRVSLPAGKSVLRLYRLDGAMAWEYRGTVSRQAAWINLPARFTQGAFFLQAL